MLRVIGSISTNIGLAPCQRSECDVATKEYGVVITSPVMRSACNAVIKASVPLTNKDMCAMGVWGYKCLITMFGYGDLGLDK
jgi:hypothetical protein